MNVNTVNGVIIKKHVMAGDNMPIQRPDSRIILDESITSINIKDKSIKAVDLSLLDNLSFFQTEKISNQALNKNVWTKVIFDNKKYDVNNNFIDNALIIDEDSVWLLYTSISFSNKTDYVRLAMFLNDDYFKECTANVNNIITDSNLFKLNKNDKIEVFAYSTKDIIITPDHTFFNGVKVVW